MHSMENGQQHSPIELLTAKRCKFGNSLASFDVYEHAV